MKSFVVAIDGPSGAGKSVVARTLAKRLNFLYVDTGAMYRAAALKAAREGIAADDDAGLEKLLKNTEIFLALNGDTSKVTLDGTDVTEQVRTPEASMAASDYSKSPAVRARLVDMQRQIGKTSNIVMEGRDIGTVVFPDASAKFYLDASDEVRSKRRFEELKLKNKDLDLAQTRSEMAKRDRQDSSRELAPLKIAEGATEVDTTSMTIEEVVETLEIEVKRRLENYV